MAKIINIRNVPDELYRVLKARAEKLGMSLSAYVMSETKEIAEQPDLAEMQKRLDRRRKEGFD